MVLVFVFSYINKNKFILYGNKVIACLTISSNCEFSLLYLTFLSMTWDRNNYWLRTMLQLIRAFNFCPTSISTI